MGLSVAEPFVEEHEEVAVAVGATGGGAGVGGEGGGVGSVGSVDVEGGGGDVFDVDLFGAAGGCGGVLDGVVAVGLVIIFGDVLFVIIKLPGGIHDLVVEAVIFGIAVGAIAGARIGAGVAHDGVVLVAEWPIVSVDVAVFFFEGDEEDLGVDVVGLGGFVDDFGGGEHAGFFEGATVEGGFAGGGVFVIVGEANVGGLVVAGVAGVFHHFGVFGAGGIGIDGDAVNGAAAADGFGTPSVAGNGFALDERFDLS